MGIILKPLAEIAKKFVTRAQAASPDYEAGVKSPGKDWASETKAAEGSYQAGVQAAISRGAFGKGVAEAGTGKWQEKASTLGKQRYGPGVAQAGADFQKGFASMADVLSRISLPPRGAKGDPGNLERVRAVDTALHAEKVK